MLARKHEEEYVSLQELSQQDDTTVPSEISSRTARITGEPYRKVLDTKTRAHIRTFFIVSTVLALFVTIGSGLRASRGYALVAVQQKAQALEQENERLKIDIAKLKSPERIKTIAIEELGMEVPKHTYFVQEK